MSKQATIHKKIIENLGSEVIEISTKSHNPLKLNLLRGLLFNTGTDIVNVYCSSWWGFLPAIYSVIVAKLVGCRVFVNYHGGYFSKFHHRWNIVINFFMKPVDLIIVPSQFLKIEFNKVGFRNVRILPNVVGKGFLDVGRIKREVMPKFIITRSLEKIYSVDDSIRAFGIITETYKEAKLWVLGSGSMEAEMKSLVAELDLTDKVVFTGHVPHVNITEYYMKASIALNSSLVDNMPLSLIEAMACGLCVVTTGVGGIPYIIENEVNGLIVDKHNPSSMAEVAIKLLNDSDLANRIITNGKKTVAKNYNVATIKPILEETYNFV